MTRPTVYVETTIPSIYYTARTGADSIARRDWTRKWWAIAASQFELVTSQVVVDELSSGILSLTKQRLELIAGLSLLPTNTVVFGIAENYILQKVMPSKPPTDALHLALASYYKCEYLVTWNYKHLANANKFLHIRVANSAMGLFVPSLVTPLELLGEDDDTADE